MKSCYLSESLSSVLAFFALHTAFWDPDFFPFFFFLYRFYLFLERGDGRGKERERNINWLLLAHAPRLRTSWQLRQVPWPGIELATFHFAGQYPTNWATPVRARILSFKLHLIYGYRSFCCHTSCFITSHKSLVLTCHINLELISFDHSAQEAKAKGEISEKAYKFLDPQTLDHEKNLNNGLA